MRRIGAAATGLDVSLRSCMIVTEGPDDERLIRAILSGLGAAPDVGVCAVGGKDSIGRFVAVLASSAGFRERCRAFAVVRDADDDPAAAFDSVRFAMARAGLPEPPAPGSVGSGEPSIGVFIWPDCASRGTLEDLFLRAESEAQAMPCVEQYVSCLEGRGIDLRWPSKTRVKVLLASRVPPRDEIREEHTSDLILDSPIYEPLKRFLRDLAAAAERA